MASRYLYQLLHRNHGELEDLGNPADSCNWTISTQGLTSESIVYSAGVGRDISFERELVARYGMKIILLDPSPTGVETMRELENRVPQFEFLPMAISGESGHIVLGPPPNPAEGSWVTTEALNMDKRQSGDEIRVPSISIPELAKQRGHETIDLLKMDVEGAEFDVIQSILQSKLIIKQIAVEFHNGILVGIRRSQTVRTLLQMYARGYRLVHKGGSNHTLLLKQCL